MAQAEFLEHSVRATTEVLMKTGRPTRPLTGRRKQNQQARRRRDRQVLQVKSRHNCDKIVRSILIEKGFTEYLNAISDGK